jgi:hypothetical protein
MKRILLATVAAISFAASPANAAEMWVKDKVLYIRGDILEGDFDQFKKLVIKNKLPRGAGVALKSQGGIVAEGLNIGLGIRAMQFKTVAIDECISVCALMWLAGKPRAVFDTASVGFHSAYRLDGNGNPQTASVGNAYAGAYLMKLGFGWDTIAYLTQAAPKEMEWLDEAKAKKYDIQVTVLKTPTQAKKPQTSRKREVENSYE